MAVLSQKEIQQHLSEMSGWIFVDNSIERQFEFPNFGAAMKFVNRVAEAAEEANHHPDIDIRYSKVKISLTSHDSGGVTSRDLRLAKKIAEIAANQL